MYKLARNVVVFLFRVLYRVKIKNIDKIPEGAFIISGNHTHIFDPIPLLMLTKRQINFMAKKELFKNKIANWFFTKVGAIPVDRENNDFNAIKKSMRVIKNDGILGIFPEGTRVKEVNIDNMKKGVALIALKTKTKIVPVHIESSYRLFSKAEITVYDYIDSSQYVNMEETEAIDKLTKDLFESIYQ